MSTITIAHGIELPDDAIAEICRAHQVKERGELWPDSDFDVLVDFLPDARPGLLGVSAMARELSEILGRRVDLAVKPALKPLVRLSVLSEDRVPGIRSRAYVPSLMLGL